MFGFLTSPSSPASALQSLSTASAWIRAQSGSNSDAHRNVVLALHDVAAVPAAIDRDCVSALNLVDGAVEEDRQRQIAQYVANVDRSAAIASCIWNSMYEVNQAFVGAYKAGLRAALAPQRIRSGQAIALKLLILLIRRFGIEIKLRAFRYQRLDPAKWIELHELYRHVVDRDLETVPISLRRIGTEPVTTTAQREYLHALFLDRINTGNLSPTEFELVSERLRDWSRDIVLDTEPAALGGFVIDMAGKTGLVRRAGREQGPTLRFVDTSNLVHRFRREIAAMNDIAVIGHDASRTIAGSIAAFAKTWPSLAMVFTLDQRRAPRTPVAAKARVAIGMAQVCDQLAGLREEIRTAPAPSGDEAAATWTIVERGEASLRLRTATAARTPVAVGALLAIQSDAEGGWLLGVARRVCRLNDDVAEVGVSILASQVVPATLHIEQQARNDMHVLVDGVDMSGIGAVFRGLYIPPERKSTFAEPKKDALSVGTLIVPTTNHDIGRRAVIAAGDEVRTLVLREPLEQHADWTWTIVEPRRAA